MNKLLLVAVLALAALSLRAQSPTVSKMETPTTDSVSVMLRHIANTNAEMQFINDNLRLHSQIALGSFALEALGGACLMMTYYHYSTGMRNLGVAMCIAGGVGFVCSYIPIWTKKIRVDNRGLVINIGGNNGTR